MLALPASAASAASEARMRSASSSRSRSMVRAAVGSSGLGSASAAMAGNAIGGGASDVAAAKRAAYSPSALYEARSEERRVGKECRSRGAPYHLKKKKEERGVSGI